MILMPCCLYAGVHVQAVIQEGHEGHHHKAGANAVQVPAVLVAAIRLMLWCMCAGVHVQAVSQESHEGH